MWYMHDFGGWWMVGGGILMLLFWGGLVALIIWGITRITKHETSTTRHSPIDIARERYSRGEITREQFEQYKKDLV